MSGAARAPGRPTTGTKVQVRIPAELLERIDQLAEEYGVSRAEFIRRTLVAAVPVVKS